MKELLDQRLQEFATLPESEQPSTLFLLRRWHRELEQKAEAREQDVGASVIDLEVSCLTKPSALQNSFELHACTIGHLCLAGLAP